MSLSDTPPDADRLLDSLATLVPFVRRDVVLRNYDDERAYDVTLRVREDGRTREDATASGHDGAVFQRRYHLDPGESATERAVLDPGTYEVTVALADGREDSARCRVGDGRARTVRVEAGNSVVTVADGVS